MTASASRPSYDAGKKLFRRIRGAKLTLHSPEVILAAQAFQARHRFFSPKYFVQGYNEQWKLFNTRLHVYTEGD